MDENRYKLVKTKHGTIILLRLDAYRIYGQVVETPVKNLDPHDFNEFQQIMEFKHSEFPFADEVAEILFGGCVSLQTLEENWEQGK